MRRRASGLLLHITSLPSFYGIGDLGPQAFRFAEFLSGSGQSFWQILPLAPTNPESHSPYNASSAFACNTLLISPEIMVRDGLLRRADLEDAPDFPDERVNFEMVWRFKQKLLQKAFNSRGRTENQYREAYRLFCEENDYWLRDYALFSAVKRTITDRSWNTWPPSLKDRKRAQERFSAELAQKIEQEKYFQFIFDMQWKRLKAYCNHLGIRIIGDMPYYVGYDSADVWANTRIFKLDVKKEPAFVGGVPPDCFSATGQLWGNPVYNWDRLKETGYAWWIKRIKRNLELFDYTRIDHFRGFVSYWEVPARQKSAIRGKWVNCPAVDFFNTLLKHFPCAPLIAEDLGFITPDVREVMRKFNFPGMRVLLFAFGEDIATTPHAPHNHTKNVVVYTGTHDNNPIKGWFEQEASEQDKKRLFHYLGRRVALRDLHWALIRLAMMSPADSVIIPMQDLLGLGAGSRMNRPATLLGNWTWRLRSFHIRPKLMKKLLNVTRLYGRI
ncbi:MAG: 4-alpha-glucanotransferase [Syntrophales bacterium]